MTNFQDEPNTKVSIVKGGEPSLTVEDVGKMLWLEGFAYPAEKGKDGGSYYAVVTKAHIEAVLSNLYEVNVPAQFVIRWLRQVGLIQYGESITREDGSIVFRYVCAKAMRGRNPVTIEDVDNLIEIHKSVMRMLDLPKVKDSVGEFVDDLTASNLGEGLLAPEEVDAIIAKAKGDERGERYSANETGMDGTLEGPNIRCVCGHIHDEHWRGWASCMGNPPEGTWCPCGEFAEADG